ncbi:hypothetical protein [Amycolatopsis keratiniphila]|uniref:Uncharacterized protein n=1 Tax=Amycolatopsis keratiniphila TaxID=129921 RepID=W6HY44_9PSEU|nr:hypothetical protein [Amycolatopsis keratiniphila]AHJ58523.1 hypothetical protein AORI_P008 [Amycolatopsis keratiniphila]
MTEAADAQESAPEEVWPMLRAWAEEIVSADYTDAVSLETLCELWENRPRPLQLPTLAEEITNHWVGAPAWVPDETWSVPYDHVRHLQQHRGRTSGWHPPTAA